MTSATVHIQDGCTGEAGGRSRGTDCVAMSTSRVRWRRHLSYKMNGLEKQGRGVCVSRQRSVLLSSLFSPTRVPFLDVCLCALERDLIFWLGTQSGLRPF